MTRPRADVRKEFIEDLLKVSTILKRPLPLTEKQKGAMEWIVGFVKVNLYPPTYKEIMEGTGIKNLGSVHSIIQALERKGHIVRDHFRARSIWPMMKKEGEGEG